MKGLPEGNQPSQKRVHEEHQQEDHEVDGAHRQEQHTLARLAVVKLPQSRDNRKYDRHVGVTLVVLSC